MNRRATKCGHCKKAFNAVKIDQQYCSQRCRQAAYRKRKTTAKPSKPVLREQGKNRVRPAQCLHCQGAYWAKTDRSVFCSTSCRTLYHRALKAAIPPVLMQAFGVPSKTAWDLVETQTLAELRSILATAGFIYQHPVRAWLRGSID